MQSHHPLRGCIACAKKFCEYLRLRGILNDPVCCMTLLAIEWSLLQRRWSDGSSEDCQWFLNGPDNSQNCPFPLGNLRPHLINMVPWTHPSLRPKRHVDQFSRFCTAHRIVCLVSHYFTMGRYVPTPQNATSPWGIGSPSNTWYLGLTRVVKANGTSIGSAVFVWIPNAMHCQWGRKLPNCPSPCHCVYKKAECWNRYNVIS